jgi:hypothetical protein
LAIIFRLFFGRLLLGEDFFEFRFCCRNILRRGWKSITDWCA